MTRIIMAALLLALSACGTSGAPGSVTARANGRAGFYMGGGSGAGF